MSLPGRGAGAGYGEAMSAVTRPRGPLPARVYWTRRLLVLSVALLLVLGIGKALGGGSDASSDEPTASRAAAETTTTSPPATGLTTGPRATPTKKPKKAAPTRKPLAVPDGPCVPEDVTVDGLIDKAAAGDAVRIVFELTTPDPACSFVFGQDTVAVKITSGEDLIWTSQQCRTLSSKDVVVRAEKPARVAWSWSGRRSNEGCVLRQAAWARAGDYHVIAAPFGGEPTDQQFTLVNPSRKTITKAPEPKQKNGSTPTDEPAGGTPSGATEPG